MNCNTIPGFEAAFAFSFCGIIYTLSVKISRYLKIPLVDLCKTSYSRRQSSKEYVTLSITNENAEMEGVNFKILGRATLNVFIFIKVAGSIHLLRHHHCYHHHHRNHFRHRFLECISKRMLNGDLQNE